MTDTSKIVEYTAIAAPDAPYFTPHQDPPSGSAVVPQPDGKEVPSLFQPIKLRELQLQNKIVVAPLCQYSAEDGLVTGWHKAHIGGIVSRGPGLTFVEATAVVPEGRITPEDVGIWDDKHIAGWKEITDFAHSQSQKIGIQLAHAGRKASTVAPYLSFGMIATEKLNGWPNNVYAPSAEPYSDTFPTPHALTIEQIKEVVQAFADGAKRALKAGFDTIQIHNAHGYLLSSFVSPHTNKRTDQYGGSFENRIRLTLEVVDAIRAVIPETMPLFLRITATDWLEESLPNEPSWKIEDTIKLTHVLAEHGVDVVDISSGGNSSKQKIGTFGSSSQSDMAKEVRESLPAVGLEGKILISAVGGIKDGKTAETYLQEGKADLITVGRQFQKNPGTVWAFAEDLDVSIYVAKQIGWGFGGRGTRVTRKA